MRFEVFEVKEDDIVSSVTCGLNVVRSDEDQPVSELKTATMERSIRQWGAKVKVYNVKSLHWRGEIELEAYEETGIGEKMFDVYNQRMLIVIFDSARIFDPGGEDLMGKESQSNLIQQ